MGAALSIPFLAFPAVSTLGSWVASCCGAAACTALCQACGSCQSSIATRIAYALLLVLNSILSWIMLSGFAIKKLEKLMMGYLHIQCPQGKCYGVLAVHRINFALAMFHVILAVLLIGVHSSKDKRATIQNGYWGPKLLAWASLIVLSFFIPNQFFMVWGNYINMTGSVIFIIFGLFLLVDFAHTWAETCLQKVEMSDSKGWQYILVGSTLGLYLACIAMTIVMYIFFARSNCNMNQGFITVNLILCIVATATSIHPMVQEYNPSSGIAQSAMVCAYTTYLTLSSLVSEPPYRNCNPITKSSQTATTVLGALFTFSAIAYSTTRAATTGSSIRLDGPEAQLTADNSEDHDLITTQPSERARMRQEALEAAVESGTLPASALRGGDQSDDTVSEEISKDDERGSVQYQYSLFHLIFFLATCYVAALLTGWNTLSFDDDEGDDSKPFVVIGRSLAIVWVKILSSWSCHALYIWSCVAPVVLPDRFGA